jgi:hypothetical protein
VVLMGVVSQPGREDSKCKYTLFAEYNNLVRCCVCALWFVRWPRNPPRTPSRDRRLCSLLFGVVLLV